MGSRILLGLGALLALSAILLATPTDTLAQRARRPSQHAVRVLTQRPRVVRRLPAAHVGLTLRGTPFFYYGGAFYRSGAGGYVVVGRPVGALAMSLPVGAVRVSIGASVFYRHQGVFFVQVDDRYEVVEPPVGASVDALPMGYEIVPTEFEDLYYHEGIYYRYDPGRDAYLIVEVPEG